MSIPVPLGVRIYSPVNSLDVWVTRWVSDLTYRSVVPGGFASATFTLHTPQHVAGASAAWSPRAERNLLVRLFNRVQVVDLRSGEIAWEGRIESAARAGDDGWAWSIGCTGAMAVASDITRPVFYADSEVTDWTDWTPTNPDLFSGGSSSDSGPTLKYTLKNNNTVGPMATTDVFVGFAHTLCLRTNQYLGRFSITYGSVPPTGTTGTSISARADVQEGDIGPIQTGVDSTAFGTHTRKSNRVSTEFTSTSAQIVILDVFCSLAAGVPTGNQAQAQGIFTKPVVLAMRQDRNGANLTASSNYPNDWVTVSQVVEDVVGRFLNGGWSISGGNIPNPGSVSPTNLFVDSSDTTHITNLKYTDGATAATILNDLITVQTDAYWAIWESTFTATDATDRARYRFEWATWPAGWGYLASSADGIDEQPDGGDIYNFVWYQYEVLEDDPVTSVKDQEWWDSTSAPLLAGNVTRAATVKKDGVITDADAATLAAAWIVANGTERNAGTITIARPIQLYDKGTASYSGASRMVDPHMLRPGKLIRVTDLPAQADGANFAHGDNAPPATHAGVVFKVVATNYDANANTCTMELDQPSTWSLPGQIVPGAKTNVQTIPG